MATFLIQPSAARRLDNIHLYTLDHWGEAQAQRYTRGLFQHFDAIANNQTQSRPIPAEFGVQGYFTRYEKHFVYWKKLNNGNIGIVTILHERMHHIERFRDDFQY